MASLNFDRTKTRAQILALGEAHTAVNGCIYIGTDGGIFVGKADGSVIMSTQIPAGSVERSMLDEAVQTELSGKANKDGYYENLGAGYAKSMLGTGASVPAEFTRRTAGGTADIASGVATFKDIEGNTIVWNQLVDENTTEVTLVSGHKYNTHIGQTEEGVTTYTDSIVTGTGSAIAVSEGDMVFDLTKMTIASAISTPADFKVLFPNSYYPYNTGQLLSLTAQKFVTDGFNQFDDDTLILGKYRQPTGVEQDMENRRRSDVYFQCLPSTNYYATTKPIIEGNYGVVVCWYDANKQYISGVATSAGVITSPNNAAFFRVSSADATCNICINLSWSGVRNGEYEPYWKSEKALNLTTITGKLNGQGESVAIFPDGVKSAGTAHDELTSNKAIVRMALVSDLSGLQWQRTGAVDGHYRWYSTGLANRIKKLDTAGQVGNLLTTRYQTGSANNSFLKVTCISSDNSGYIFIYDPAYDDAEGHDAFVASLSGLSLVYELATPQTYVLDEPLDPNYRVDDFGTEGIAPLTDAQGNPVTAPIKADIVYGPNVQDTIRRLPTNYLSIADYKTGVENLASALGASLEKTIAVTWGGDNGSVPTFTITDNPTE